MSGPFEWRVEAALAAFDEHLRRVRGVSAGTRANYARFAGAFLEGRFAGGEVVVGQVSVADVVGFVGASAERYQPRTVELVATSLRSLFRYFRSEGLCGDALEMAVPMVPHRRRSLVRHLPAADVERLIESLSTASVRGLRDRAVILCVARLGLRSGEVAALRLDDIEWRQATVRVRARKTGHGARLPLTAEVGEALADYLQHGRPETAGREVFVLVTGRPGAAISTSIVGRAVDRALTNAGMDAPARGGNLLRHSLATGLQARGVGLAEIAGLLGHTCLATTRIYAAVDVAALAEVALPWPVTS